VLVPLLRIMKIKKIEHISENTDASFLNHPEVARAIKKAEKAPIKLWDYWIFKGLIYQVGKQYSDDEAKLLILEEIDKERMYFEKLKKKFETNTSTANRSTDRISARPRIPERIRIEIWRRDGGKCARCGSRENLEYDHIVPLSRGGSNTARNIELLCEKCNRSKSNNIV
jgi:hypothetical protein